VFGDASVATPREALTQWEEIKRREADAVGRHRSVLEGVPRGLPSLLRAQRLQEKAARVHFDWPDARAAWSKVEEELREAAGAVDTGDRERVQEEIGDLLFSLVNVARLSTIDPEEALQGAIAKFTRRFTQMEKALSARGTSVGTASPDEMEHAWTAVKARERAAGADRDSAAQGKV
jgi:MazG family protein